MDLLNGIFKRIYYVYNLSVLGQRNYTHKKKHEREKEREKIHHELYKPSQVLESNFFCNDRSQTWTLPHPFFTPLP